MRPRALIYAGQGTSPTCVTALCHAIRRVCVGFVIEKVDYKTLCFSPWERSTALLVVPGGRDVPYVRLLGAQGARFCAFVRRGGRYLGSCAGAYFAARSIAFDAQGPLAVVGRRPLGLWPGAAHGPKGRHKFAYDDARTASAMQLFAHDGHTTYAYTHGGCTLAPAAQAQRQVRIFARYYDGEEIAVAGVSHGAGRALMWGLHAEIDAVQAKRLGLGDADVARLCASATSRAQLWARSLRWLMAARPGGYMMAARCQAAPLGRAGGRAPTARCSADRLGL